MMAKTTLSNYFQETKIPLRLACTTASGWPVVLSLWYLFEDGNFYCATPRNAKVIAHLQANPRCAFEVAADLPPYCGVRGRAIATVDEARGMEILERLLHRYLGGVDNSLGRMLLSRSAAEVAIRLEPQTMHTWNFSDRMVDVGGARQDKLCPEL